MRYILLYELARCLIAQEDCNSQLFRPSIWYKIAIFRVTKPSASIQGNWTVLWFEDVLPYRLLLLKKCFRLEVSYLQTKE